MELEDIMDILQNKMKVAVFATVDEENKPHARHITVGVANKHGVFFMTHPRTDFYKQLQHNQNVAITGFLEKDYLIQVIRIEGVIRKVGREQLATLLAGNPYVDYVYPESADQQSVQVFQLYKGAGFYQSLTQGHRYGFEIDADALNNEEVDAL